MALFGETLPLGVAVLVHDFLGREIFRLETLSKATRRWLHEKIYPKLVTKGIARLFAIPGDDINRDVYIPIITREVMNYPYHTIFLHGLHKYKLILSVLRLGGRWGCDGHVQYHRRGRLGNFGYYAKDSSPRWSTITFSVERRRLVSIDFGVYHEDEPLSYWVNHGLDSSDLFETYFYKGDRLLSLYKRAHDTGPGELHTGGNIYVGDFVKGRRHGEFDVIVNAGVTKANPYDDKATRRKITCVDGYGVFCHYRETRLPDGRIEKCYTERLDKLSKKAIQRIYFDDVLHRTDECVVVPRKPTSYMPNPVGECVAIHGRTVITFGATTLVFDNMEPVDVTDVSIHLTMDMDEASGPAVMMAHIGDKMFAQFEFIVDKSVNQETYSGSIELDDGHLLRWKLERTGSNFNRTGINFGLSGVRE